MIHLALTIAAFLFLVWCALMVVYFFMWLAGMYEEAQAAEERANRTWTTREQREAQNLTK